MLKALLVLALLGGASPARAGGEADCRFDLADVPNPPRFEDFPVPAAHTVHPAPPKLVTRDDRMFRTMIRRGAEAGPNFAGPYTIAAWGCGASCLSTAIVDARTGHVFPSFGLGVIDASHVGDEPAGPQPEYSALRFRPDSRLLIVLGAPDEDQARDGVAFYEWTGAALRPLRFVPRREICGTRQPP